jgi:hypothetical protein
MLDNAKQLLAAARADKMLVCHCPISCEWWQQDAGWGRQQQTGWPQAGAGELAILSALQLPAPISKAAAWHQLFFKQHCMYCPVQGAATCEAACSWSHADTPRMPAPCVAAPVSEEYHELAAEPYGILAK